MYRHRSEIEGSNWRVIGKELEDQCDPDSACNWLYTDDMISVSIQGCAEYPEEVNICGENTLTLPNGYQNKNLDLKYVRMYDNGLTKFYYKSGQFYLWYDDSRFNWVVSTEKFNPDTAVMFRHKDNLLGSDWLVLGSSGMCFKNHLI